MAQRKRGRGQITRREFLAVSSVAFLAACTPTGATPSASSSAPASLTPKAGGTFVYASAAELPPLKPGPAIDTQRVLGLIQEGLVQEDLHDTKSSSLKIVPNLAESWDVSPDGLQYTMKLRQNVRFHDGTAFDAGAVKANYERATLTTSPVFDKAVQSSAAKIYSFVAKGEVVDKFTFRYTLKNPVGEFIRLLGDRQLLIASPASLQKYAPDDIANHPVGTGPFKFVQRVPGQKVVLEKNADYWGGAPYLDQVIVSIITDAQARMAAIRSGDVDAVLDVLPDQVATYQKDSNINVVFQQGPHIYYWGLNCREGPTANKAVRQAINYAWNRDALTKDLLLNLAAPAISPVPPNNPASPPNRPPYTYDPDRAKSLLQSAGFPSGFSMTLQFGDQGNNEQINTLIQSDLKKVGIDVKLVKLEYAASVAALSKGIPSAHGAVQTFGTASAALESYLDSMFYSKSQPPNGNNRSWYVNTDVDKLLDAARPISDPQKNAEGYRKALDQIVDDAPWLWLFHNKTAFAIRKRVHGLDVPSSIWFDLKTVWVEG